MKLYKIYFSPTGGTKKCIDILSKAFLCDQEEIDLLKRQTETELRAFSPEDVCLVAVPSFGGRVPEIVLEKLSAMQGRGARAVLTAVYGNRDFDDTLLELQDTLKNAGFVCTAAVAAVAEHSIMHQYGAGRPDEADEKELHEFGEEIYKLIVKMQKTGSVEANVQVPGKLPYREYHGVPFKPEAGKKCTKCGICVKECPVGAIPEENPASVDKEKCISCMHCIAVCPSGIRGLNKILLAAAAQKMKKELSGRKQNRLFM